MPENIIDLNAHRRKGDPEDDQVDLLEQMSLIEDLIEQMDELGISTRDELVDLLEKMDASIPDESE